MLVTLEGEEPQERELSRRGGNGGWSWTDSEEGAKPRRGWSWRFNNFRPKPRWGRPQGPTEGRRGIGEPIGRYLTW